ncbi:MAG: PrsW family glutamic-type intramembrane protease [Actinomycetota bacterium]|nr:PrsW family glutamic-type intramembrane protease [Actinomycetota bacterium]
MMAPLLALAVLPGLGLLYFVWKHDRLEKEPTKLLVMLFLFGMLSAPIAGIVEAVALNVLGNILDFGTIIGGIVEFLFVVAIAEEGIKFIFLQTVSKNDAFDCTFDGIVYAVCVGLGFAVLENVLYVFGSATESLGSGMATGVLRSFTAVPMHCCCAIYMGFFFGQQKLHEAQGNRALASKDQVYSLLVPILMHGFYDFGVSSEYSFVLQVTFGLMITMYVLAFYRVRISSVQDTRFKFPVQMPVAYAGQVVNGAVMPGGYQDANGNPVPAQPYGQAQQVAQGVQPAMTGFQQAAQQVQQPGVRVQQQAARQGQPFPQVPQQAPHVPQQPMHAASQQAPQGVYAAPQVQQAAQAAAWAPQQVPQAQPSPQPVAQAFQRPMHAASQQAPQVPQAASQMPPQAPQAGYPAGQQAPWQAVQAPQAPQQQAAHMPQQPMWAPQQFPQGTGQVPAGSQVTAGSAEGAQQDAPLPPDGNMGR